MPTSPLNILCVSRFFKGNDFLTACKDAGHSVYLLTSRQLESAEWAREALTDVYLMDEDQDGNWNMDHVSKGIAFKMRGIQFDRLVALDDFDVENTARLREQFRIPGMGETTARYFRDKLAMRIKAEEAGIPIPAFVPLFHDADIHAYTQKVAPPWMIKPRSAASARGIQKIHSAEQLWQELNQLGDQRHTYLLEKFAPGQVYHVDALNLDGNTIFSRSSQYLDTPFEVSHGGGVFRSHTIEFDSEDDKKLRTLNEQVMRAFGMKYSASHTEFIKDNQTGEFYFLETSSRVGGANLAEMVEASSGINLWREWAKIEIAMALDETYTLPKINHDYAGIVVSLSRYLRPDMSVFSDSEVCWRMEMDWHVGMIVRDGKRERVLELLDQYTQRIQKDFHASLPAEEAPRG